MAVIKKAAQGGLVLAFLLVCAGVALFLHRFTIMGSSQLYLEWESAAICTAEGGVQPFDPAGGEPALDEGEWFRFTATLPARADSGSYLIFEFGGAACRILVDGQELYASAAPLAQDTVNLGRALISLPAGGGEPLVMEIRPLGETLGIFPPLLRLSADPSDARGNIAYANHYGFSAGAMALTLVLLWGLFLLSAAGRRPDWRLLLLLVAAACLTVQPIATAYGWYFFPQPWLSLLSWTGMPVVAAAALALYLALRRGRAFRRSFRMAVLWSLGALLVCVVVSALRGGYLASYLAAEWSALLATGYHDGLLYWLTVWLVGVCALLSGLDMLHATIQMQTRARALALKNRLVMENYRHLEEKMQETAALHHEWSHQLTLLGGMYEAKDWDAIGHYLETVQARSRQTALWTENLALNAMLQHTSAQADKAGIRLDVSAMLPRTLPIPEEDLCTFFMNLLENALEAAAQAEAGERFIRLRLSIKNGYLTVLCENSYGGRLSVDEHGKLHTTKPEPESHGFGLSLMQKIAEAYGSILDISYTGTVFTVQTALKLPA